jgi:hypothetical protein
VDVEAVDDVIVVDGWKVDDAVVDDCDVDVDEGEGVVEGVVVMRVETVVSKVVGEDVICVVGAEVENGEVEDEANDVDLVVEGVGVGVEDADDDKEEMRVDEEVNGEVVCVLDRVEVLVIVEDSSDVVTGEVAEDV